GAVIIWALMRRGAEWSKPFLEMPGLLIAAQWATLVFEFLSPIALFLKGKWLYGVVAFFCLFHLMTYLALGIHFLPTVICWVAFLPLDRLVPGRFAAPEARGCPPCAAAPGGTTASPQRVADATGPLPRRAATAPSSQC